MNIKNLHNKKIAILGFGKEGQSTLKFLKKQNITDIVILDQKLKSRDVDLLLGEDRESYKVFLGEEIHAALDTVDIIIKSPGLSPFQKKLLPYREKFISQTQIFFSNYTGKVIGITGTKGKSTISTLLHACLEKGGLNAKLVGNIGKPVLDEIDIVSNEENDYVIYELSSYMLQDFAPNLEIGLLNNIYPCHLDWHYDSFTIYKEAKLNLLKDSKVKILHGDLAQDSEVALLRGKKLFFDTKGEYQYEGENFLIGDKNIYSGEVMLLGEHNQKNISGVLAVLDQVFEENADITDIFTSVLPEFGGLPNRIEDIGTYENIRFINDAIATTPQSTIAAIKTFSGSLQTLFLGGEDSGFDFNELRDYILNSNIQNIIAFPDTSEKIFPEIAARDYESAFEIEIAGKSIQFIKTRSMRSGVDFAYKTTLPGKLALLSCASPSFSLWKSYLDKAAEFIKEVKEY